MAFDAAAAGEGGSRRAVGGGVSGGGGEDSLLTTLSQRVWTLTQALAAVEKCVAQVGTAADSSTLRVRLAAAEAKASALWGEIDSGARKLRVATAAGGDRAALDRFQQLYSDSKKRLQAALLASRERQAAHAVPASEGAGATAGSDGYDGYRGGGGRGGAGAGAGVELSSMRQMGDVENAIVEERQREAAHIASSAVEVNETFKDLGGLVHNQGETLTKIETTVDTSRESVVKANKDLVAAASYQRSYRCKCLFFWLLLIAVIIAIAVPVALHFTGNNS